MILQVEQANADIRAVTEANAGSESEIAVLKNESEHSRFRIDEATGELERAGQGRQSIETETAGHKAAIEKLHGEVAALDARVSRTARRTPCAGRKSCRQRPAPGRYRRRYCPPAGHRHCRESARRLGPIGKRSRRPAFG